MADDKSKSEKDKTVNNDEMMQRIAQGLREGYIRDMQKPEFDYFERAAIIRQYLDERDWSIRKMGRELGIPRSTLEDWLLYNRISKEKYDELLEKGMTHTEIYRQLREKKSQKKQEVDVTTLDQFIDDTKKQVRKYRKKDFEYSPKTKGKIDELIDELNRIKVKINEKERNGD